jgi:hypothetical protein
VAAATKSVKQLRDQEITMSALQASSLHTSAAGMTTADPRYESTFEDQHRHNILSDLASETGIVDSSLLEELLRFEIKPDLIRALDVSPLFFMAWADGDMDVCEDQFIHDYLRRLEAPISGASYRLVCHWFNVPPAAEYLSAWQVYMRGKLPTLAPAERSAMHHALVRLVTNLAQCSGGFLGFGSRISSAEHAMLRKLETVFLETH